MGGRNAEMDDADFFGAMLRTRMASRLVFSETAMTPSARLRDAFGKGFVGGDVAEGVAAGKAPGGHVVDGGG
jgi:hypothetical protein